MMMFISRAEATPLERDFGFKSTTSLRDRLRAFAKWYAKYPMEQENQ